VTVKAVMLRHNFDKQSTADDAVNEVILAVRERTFALGKPRSMDEQKALLPEVLMPVAKAAVEHVEGVENWDLQR